jgi:DNA mismatch endonuclease (patch repair protein)
MRRQRQKDTQPEILVRRALHRLGHRFRVQNRDLPGSPDAANRKRRWAVFVHGCYWHAHEGCPRHTIPKRNRAFWLEKFRANRARDERAAAELREQGYRVFTIWECEVGGEHETEALILEKLGPRTASRC